MAAPQVQFLSMAGRIGGSQGSQSMQQFSSNFEWTNYKLGPMLFGGAPEAASVALLPVSELTACDEHSVDACMLTHVLAGESKPTDSSEASALAVAPASSRRQDGRDSQPTDAGTQASSLEGSSSGRAACSWAAMEPPIEVVVTCAVCLTAVFILRSILYYVLKTCMNRQIDGLLFPAWEGWCRVCWGRHLRPNRGALSRFELAFAWH